MIGDLEILVQMSLGARIRAHYKLCSKETECLISVNCN